MRCKPHGRTNCTDTTCRKAREDRERRESTSTYDAMSDPTSPLHQTVYGGIFYGTGSGSADCGSSSSSSSSDSGSSSSSPCDSGSY